VETAIAIQPTFFVIENVRGLLSCPGPDGDRGGALKLILEKIKDGGYGYSFNLYNAANFGSPQVRERLVIICAQDGSIPPFLTPTHDEKGEFGLPRWSFLASAIADLKDHDYVQFPEKRLKYYRLLKQGQNWRDLPLEEQKAAMGNSFYSGGGKTGFFRRLHWDKPSPTLVTHPAMPATSLAHPEEDRPLSIQEYKRIQGFPDDWFVAGDILSRYRQIGNAVPVPLGAAIGTLIRSLIRKEPVPNYPGFKYSRYKKTSHDFFT
jgi:DNA (cytosine-5)-methyltransferase 1